MPSLIAQLIRGSSASARREQHPGHAVQRCATDIARCPLINCVARTVIARCPCSLLSRPAVSHYRTTLSPATLAPPPPCRCRCSLLLLAPANGAPGVAFRVRVLLDLGDACHCTPRPSASLSTHVPSPSGELPPGAAGSHGARSCSPQRCGLVPSPSSWVSMAPTSSADCSGSCCRAV